jgi:hypothetical protein
MVAGIRESRCETPLSSKNRKTSLISIQKPQMDFSRVPGHEILAWNNVCKSNLEAC